MSLLRWRNASRNIWIVHYITGIYLLLVCVPILNAFDCFVLTIFNLRTADCNDKNYKSIPKGFDHNLQVLQFSDNQLTYLGADEFQAYPALQEIYLDRNKLDIIFPLAFKGLLNLQLLSLESNKLAEIPVESLKYMEPVRILNFRSNQIRRIESYSLKSLVNIEDIDFENNFIEYVHPQAFSELNHLNEINLVNNELKTLSAEMQPLLPPSLEVFRIYGNPWLCDCHLRWLRTWLSTSSAYEVNWDFASNTPTCAGPERIPNVNWKRLESDHFACAARIMSNSSTTQHVTLGGNITIECEVYGDPEPRITWQRGTTVINKNGHIRKYTISEVGIKHVKSTLTLQRIEPEDFTDYKCIAQNIGGISEVTYNLLQENGGPPVQPKVSFFGLSKEVILGIAIGGALLTLILLSIVVGVLCRQQDNRKHAYKVREYRNTSNGDRKQVPAKGTENHSDNKQNHAKSVPRHVTSERKELLAEEKQNAVNAQITTQRDITQNTNSPFTMKMYATYDRVQDGVTLEGQANRQDQQQQGQSCSQATYRSPINDSRDTPDLLKDGGNNALPVPRAIPVPPPVVPSHLSSCHPRAEENPYVKPSELRSQTMKRKTASADDLLDGVKDEFTEMRRGSKSRDDLDELTRCKQRDTRDALAYGTLGKPKNKDHSSTCKNPVCLKDPNLGLEIQDYTQRSRVKSPPPKLMGAQREIDVDNMNSPESRAGSLPPSDRYGDRYKTLPGRLKHDQYDKEYSPISTVQSEYPAGPLTHQPRNHTPSSQRPSSRNRAPSTKTVSFSEQGHPIIDLTHEMPAPIVISSHRKPLPPMRGDYSTYSTPRPNPIPVPHSMRGPENISGVIPTSHKAPMSGIYGTHKAPIPNGSPVRRHRQAQSTTLDDLLSPPFGHVTTPQRNIQGSMTLPHKRKTPLKPGEKDEFGTAV